MTEAVNRQRRRRHLARQVAILLVLVSFVASCGSRRTHDEIVAGARGATETSAKAGGVKSATATPGATSSSADGTTAAGGSGTESVAGDSSGGDTSGSGGSGAASGVRAGSTMRIGLVGTLSGPAGASLAGLADGARVWVRYINDQGGLNGHKVEIVTADDGGDPSRHRALVQEFVEQRGVVAFVGNPEALTGAGSVDYLTGAGVPVIGSEGAGGYFYESPVYFPQASSGNALAQGTLTVIGAVAHQRGMTKAATINCVEVQVCRDANARAEAGFARVGLQLVYRAQASLGQPDFTAECLNANRAGAQLISLGMDANAVRAIALACARQGYHPLLIWTAGSTASSLASDPNLEGSLIVSNVGPWPSTATAGTKEFNDAMAKYAPGTVATGATMQGWVSGKVLELAATGISEPPTAKSIVDALGQVNGDPMPDITGPLAFHPGAPASPTACGFAVFIHDRAFTAGDDVGRVCSEYDPSV